MNILLSIAIQTANILGIFNDPFEFEGDYGPEVNPTRQQVFELVVSQEAMAKNLSAFEVKQKMNHPEATQEEVKTYKQLLVIQAIQNEKEHGPTLAELMTAELIEKINTKLSSLKDFELRKMEFENILNFIDQYKTQKIFHFLRNNPPELLSLDKTLRDQAAREGKEFDLPILGSTQLLDGITSVELKKNLLDTVFNQETLDLTKPPENIKQALSKLDNDYLKAFLGQSANNTDLEVFSTPLGQMFFYWMYQSLNLELVASQPALISQINIVKKVFADTLGNPVARATGLKDKLIASNTGVLFTQESDALVPQILANDGLFLPVDSQNQQDGTLIILRSDIWESNYAIVPIDGYDGSKTGRLNVILATRKDSGQRFLLASGHGHSTRAEDGRLQIQLIMEKFHQLSDGSLQLLIGIDANTKTEEDVRLFKDNLEKLGLISTQTGPTTIKRRMVTAQHSKAGRFAIDEEDYLITLKAELGGCFQFTHVTVGFAEGEADTSQPLPNVHNQSDHYPVGAEITPLH
jgi:hypothetical protein